MPSGTRPISPTLGRPLRRLLPLILAVVLVSGCSPGWVKANFCPDCTDTEAKVIAYGFTGWWQEMARRQDPRAASEAAAREFGIPVGDFLRVIDCESGFNPRAVNSSSGALGLGQHLPRYWGARAAALGYRYEDWSNPRANARVSAWLWATSGPQHWVCY